MPTEGTGVIIAKAALQIRLREHWRTMERQGSRYDRETKAQALAQAAVSTAAQAARNLQLPERTVQRWVERYLAENDGNNGWADDNRAVISRATELLMDAMDQIEDRGEAYKHVMALNALRGTSIDKEQRASNGSKAGVFVIVRSSDGSTVEVGASSEGSVSH